MKNNDDRSKKGHHHHQHNLPKHHHDSHHIIILITIKKIAVYITQTYVISHVKCFDFPRIIMNKDTRLELCLCQPSVWIKRQIKEKKKKSSLPGQHRHHNH